MSLLWCRWMEMIITMVRKPWLLIDVTPGLTQGGCWVKPFIWGICSWVKFTQPKRQSCNLPSFIESASYIWCIRGQTSHLFSFMEHIIITIGSFLCNYDGYSGVIQTITSMEKISRPQHTYSLERQLEARQPCIHYIVLWFCMHYITLLKNKTNGQPPSVFCCQQGTIILIQGGEKREETQRGASPVRAIMRAD